MKKFLFCLILASMFLLVACDEYYYLLQENPLQQNPVYVGEEITYLNFTHQIIRTFGGDYTSRSPEVFFTYEEFRQYLNKNWSFSGTWSSDGMLTPTYAESLSLPRGTFDSNIVVSFVLVETSGSIGHAINSVDSQGNISISRFVPEIGTMDMAQYLVILIIDNTNVPDQFRTCVQ